MLYPELFKSLEQVRWSMETDIPWDEFDHKLVVFVTRDIVFAYLPNGEFRFLANNIVADL